MSGFGLPSDEKKLEYLRTQEEADILAALNPEERKKYERSKDYRINSIAYAFGDLLNSEQEFEALYAIEADTQASLRKSKNEGGSPDQETSILNAEQRRQEVLGPSRTQLLMEKNDPDRRLAKSACTRLGLDSSAEQRLIALRNDCDAKSRLISASVSLSNQEKSAALKSLGNEARQQLTAMLGDEAATSYTQQSKWCRILNSGAAFTRTCTGGYLSKSFPSADRAQTPQPADDLVLID